MWSVNKCKKGHSKQNDINFWGRSWWKRGHPKEVSETDVGPRSHEEAAFNPKVLGTAKHHQAKEPYNYKLSFHWIHETLICDVSRDALDKECPKNVLPMDSPGAIGFATKQPLPPENVTL